ncbi:MAG: glycosyltransferase family A protein [Pseudomonadota bacterium]
MGAAVTVIIPVFNGERFIARAVQSALAQSLPPAQVLVVDDGSSDATVSRLAPFGARVTLIALARNGGVSQARNCAMHASHGDWIAFLDADDIWHPSKLERQLDALRACPEAQFCCSDFLVLDKSAGKMVRHFSIFGREARALDAAPLAAPFSCLLQRNFVGTSSVLMTRALMDAVGDFNTDYPQAEDYEYWLRCALLTPFLVMPQCLMEKTSHESNLTNNSLETFLCHEQVLLAMQARGQIPAAGLPHMPEALAKVRYEIAHQYFNQGETARALSYYVRGLRSRPCLSNACMFSYLLSRKAVRLATGDRLRLRRRELAR